MLKLPILKPETTPLILSVQESPSGIVKTFNNILVGELILCSGQSNMQWPITHSENSQKFIEESNQFPNIRGYTVTPTQQSSPSEILIGSGWQVTSSKVTGTYSAVCYHYARNFFKRYNVPIGIVMSSLGGTQIERWMSKESTAVCGNNAPGQETLYNGMIHPILNVFFRGMIWYQGESVSCYYYSINKINRMDLHLKNMNVNYLK